PAGAGGAGGQGPRLLAGARPRRPPGAGAGGDGAGRDPLGPHRDDVALLVDGRDSRVHASQGQQRSVVLALKQAELAAAAEAVGTAPLLLLDDVLSEL